MDWCEVGGPPVERPAIFGFGSRLIHQTVIKELMGHLDIRFEPDGVCCTMVNRLESAPSRPPDHLRLTRPLTRGGVVGLSITPNGL